MKLLNTLTLLLAGSLLVACGETMDDDGLPPDPENGLETMDGKADSFAIRPGSPEAEAVMQYVNRAIANDAQGVTFRDDLDSKLHATAAKNVAKFRAGDDGTFGTGDDKVFADLAELDRVPYIGRTALMQIFGLAEAAGLFQRASVDCADFVDHDRYNNYTINSYARLLEYENSRCSTINGNVYLQISGTDLLPPAAREIRNLRYLKTINGNLQITTSNHFNSIHFEGLQTVTGSLHAESPVGRAHTLEFAALTSVKDIYMSAIQSSLFPALEQNDNIQLVDTDLEGFTALKSAAQLAISQRPEGTFNVSFPALTEVGALKFEVYRRNSYTTPNVAFTGGFPKLTKGDSITLSSGNYAQLEFPRLAEAGGLNTQMAVDPYLGMTKLATVRSFYSNMDDFATHVHMGPAALESAGAMSITTALPIDGYDVLKTVETNISITTNYGVEGFDALTALGGSVTLNIGQSRDQANLNGFNKLSYLQGLTVSANNGPVTIGPMFERLENTEGALSLVNNGGFSVNPVFKKLNSIGGGLRVDTLLQGADMMPVLEIVDGNIAINRTPTELTGFTKLERIEGSLTLKASVNTMTGMGNLVAIGGNLSVPRSLTGTELDDFLNHLTEFSGTITYN